MTTNNNRQISRWGIIATVGILIALLIGGAIYAQGAMRRQGDRSQQGQRMGQGMGHGPGAIFGAQFLMQDEEIMQLMARIKFIEGINNLDLTRDQVIELRDLAIEAQGIMDDQFGNTRNQIRNSLSDQLESALEGNEVNPEAIRGILENARDNSDPEAVRGELEEILNLASDLLTDEQRQMMLDHEGPGREAIRNRVDEWRGGEGRGQEWYNDLSDEERAEVDSRVREHVGGMRGDAARMKLMMLLLSPQAVETLDLWLDYN